MIDYTVNFAINFSFTSLMGLLLYWLPVCICGVGYSRKIYREYSSDLSNRTSARNSKGEHHYRPTLTVGLLVGRSLVTACPGINIPVAIFQHLPVLLGRFFRWCGRLLDIPLVPK